MKIRGLILTAERRSQGVGVEGGFTSDPFGNAESLSRYPLPRRILFGRMVTRTLAMNSTARPAVDAT